MESRRHFLELNKWKQKGLDNIQRVKQTGRNVMAYPKMLSNSLSSFYDQDFLESRHSNTTTASTSTSPNTANDKTPSPLTREKYSVNDSVVSFSSDANTLVNSSSVSFSSRFGKPPKVATTTSFSSTSSNELSSSGNSLSSESTPVPQDSSAVLDEKLQAVLDTPRDLSEAITEVIKEEEEEDVQPRILNVKEYINTYNYETAFEVGQTRHLHYYELPFPWRENRCIINGYRFYNSHKKSLLSIVNWYGWHNETSNIWTHMLGGFYILYLMFYQFPNSEIYQSEQIPGAAKIIAYVFLVAAAKCLFSSVFWHTFNGTSLLHMRYKFACVDYSGISILITASILTTEFVTMYQCPWAMATYMAMSTALGIFGVFMNWSPKFDRPEARPLRIKFFILLASMGAVSFLHLSLTTSFSYSTWLLSPVTKKSVVWYLVGVVFYGTFIPERWRTDIQYDHTIPTTLELSTNLDIIHKEKHLHFRETPTPHEKNLECKHHHKSFKSLWWVDYFGCSHTLWHFFVVLGVIGHYNAILDMFTKKWLLEAVASAAQ
ncbi:ADIPOR-like receptor IZH3 [Nakaseomyces bracarensis]|uniref:ADIPOR-like receptor IZH3 n=1 Tax=Nakaseomyces bracarensis TaxID=273131 RepID=A0ABR4NQJ7_9SACH